MQHMVVDKRTSRLGFAQRLNEALTSAGVKDDQFRRGVVAKTFGVSVESVRKWLTGESMPDTARIEGIAKEYGVDANWLLSGAAQKGSSPFISDEAGTYAGNWVASAHNTRLAKALSEAHASGALTPALSEGLAAMIEAIGSRS